MLSNKSFYPTPKFLASKMVTKLQGGPGKVLEPSAGKGDLIEAMDERYKSRWGNRQYEVSAIEIDPELQATLRGKGFKVIDSDFLEYAGPDKFDTIIANPPFDAGANHLLKAIDILYRGQIVFLLNAETIRNPHDNTRKQLARKLDELGAEVEFIANAFQDAERKTMVEVALIYINIDRKIEDDLFNGCEDQGKPTEEAFEEKNEISTGRTVEELVADYNERIRIGTEVALTYFRNYRKIGEYMDLNGEPNERRYKSSEDLTSMLQGTINGLLRDVRKDFWRRTLNLKEVSSRLTSKKREEFEHQLQERCHMDFTEKNIRQFVLNLIGGYEQTLIEAVLDTFDRFTIKNSYRDTVYEKNVHYFNGWKTNNPFKVGKRVVIPIFSRFGGSFFDYGRWKLDFRASEQLTDIDLVMNYFDGMSEYTSMREAIEAAFSRDENFGESTYFKFKCHKKGTIHLTFKSDDILRRFNVVACRGKGWLPDEYGKTAYDALTAPEKAVVDSFDGEKTYSKNLNRPLFAPGKLTALPESVA